MPKPLSNEEHTDFIFIRIDWVIQTILKNDRFLHAKRNKELCSTVMEKYQVSQRTAERYIAEAKKDIRKSVKLKKEAALTRALRDREFLVAAAKEANDLKLALDAMKDREKLFGLYVDEVKHTGTISLKNIDVSKLTDDQLRTLKQKVKNNEPIEEYLKLIGLL